MKKEDLEKKLRETEIELSVEKSKNKNVIDDMRLVLGYYELSTSYGNTTRALYDKTWAEIFSEIGRLKELARQKNQTDFLKDIEEKIFSLEHNIQDLRERTNLE